MKLKTSLQLSAVFPIIFAMAIALSLRVWMRLHFGIELIDMQFMAFMGIVGLSMAGIILYYSRDILHKINILNRWIEGVLAGKLDQAIDVGEDDDEVSNLSRALGRMLSELKTAYSGLQAESQRNLQKAEDQQKGIKASQMANRHLMDALAKMKKTHTETMQQERRQVLEMALRGAAHDFSEALMPISATCELLQSNPSLLGEPDQLKDMLATINSSAAQCCRLARNLAGFAHAAEDDAGPTDGVSTLNQAVERIKPLIDDHGLTSRKPIDIRVQAEMAPPLAVSEHDFRDALVHLLRNAIEAMPDGGPIFVGISSQNSSVILDIRDTGKGMTPEVWQRCTEPYFTTHNDVGRGMGLAFVNNLVQRHGGHLMIESQPQAGTRVSLTLPAFNHGDTRRKPKPPAAATAATQPTTGRVLLVDDEKMVRSVISQFLTLKGHQVDAAPDGHSALEQLRQGKYQVVILDRSMPGMSGDELASVIRKRTPGIPILMLTGYGDIMLQEKDRPANVDLVLPKTSPLDHLVAAVQDALAGRIYAGQSKKTKPAQTAEASVFPTVDRQ